MLNQADKEYESENTRVGRYRPVTTLFILYHLRPSFPWFGTLLASWTHPECRYGVWNETAFKRNTQTVYITNPSTDNGLNLDPRELYVKLVTILKTTLQFYKYCYNIKKKVKWSCYRPGVAQRVGRGIALLFRERGIRREWVVTRTPRPHFTPGKDPVPILQEAGWAPGQVWTGGKSRPHRHWIPDRPARSQSLYRLSYPAHSCVM